MPERLVAGQRAKPATRGSDEFRRAGSSVLGERSRDGKRRLHSLHVLTVAAHGVSRVVAFQDIGAVRRFDLPASRS
jgi:hypothetical protein